MYLKSDIVSKTLKSPAMTISKPGLIHDKVYMPWGDTNWDTQALAECTIPDFIIVAEPDIVRKPVKTFGQGRKKAYIFATIPQSWTIGWVSKAIPITRLRQRGTCQATSSPGSHCHFSDWGQRLRKAADRTNKEVSNRR
jgi:hypothetical protein